jgi:hypothetical protein
MNPLVTFFTRVRQWVSGLSVRMVTRWKTTFYVYLAAIFSLLIVVDAAFLHVTANMRQAAFDVMVRYRIIVPKPDKDIVIVDINEASLASMAKEYGRWPLPRQVLGEFLEHLEEQRPKAVIFDILFSDPDVYNPIVTPISPPPCPERPTRSSHAALGRSERFVEPDHARDDPVLPPSEGPKRCHHRVVLPHFQSILQGDDWDSITSIPIQTASSRIPGLPGRLRLEGAFLPAVSFVNSGTTNPLPGVCSSTGAASPFPIRRSPSAACSTI